MPLRLREPPLAFHGIPLFDPGRNPTAALARLGVKKPGYGSEPDWSKSEDGTDSPECCLHGVTARALERLSVLSCLSRMLMLPKVLPTTGPCSLALPLVTLPSGSLVVHGLLRCLAHALAHHRSARVSSVAEWPKLDPLIFLDSIPQHFARGKMGVQAPPLNS